MCFVEVVFGIVEGERYWMGRSLLFFCLAWLKAWDFLLVGFFGGIFCKGGYF